MPTPVNPVNPVDPGSDVTIEYGDTLIGVLSDSGKAILKTKGTQSKQNIIVNYTKPSGSAIGNTVNLSTDIVDETVALLGSFFDPAGVFFNALQTEYDNPKTVLALCEEGRDGYVVFLSLESEDDVYSVTVNNTPVAFDRGAYTFSSSPTADPTNGQTYNVFITVKQV